MKYYWIDLKAFASIENLKNYVEKIIIGYGTEYGLGL